MLRTIDRILIVAVILLAAGEAYLFAGPAASSGAPGLPIPIMPVMPASAPVTGPVTAIDEHIIVVTPDIGPPGAAAGKERRFKLTDTTEIVEQAPKEPRAFQAEMAAFQKRMARAGGGLPSGPPPMPLEEKKFAVSDLKTGDRVTVMPAMGKAEGTAGRIVRQLAAPPPPIVRDEGSKPTPAVLPAPKIDPPVPPHAAALKAPQAPKKADPANSVSQTDEGKE